MMFADLVIERPPLQWSELPQAVQAWVETVGGFAAVAVLGWLIISWFTGWRVSWDPRRSLWRRWLSRLAVLGIILGYATWGALKLPVLFQAIEGNVAGSAALGSARWQTLALLVGGVSALVAVFLPFLLDLILVWRWRRIWR